jgi:salicylate hydroxylase
MSARLSKLRVAVVGAGISGLATALALAHAGIECVVFEQARVLTEVGVGIQITPNAARLLHRLGMKEYLRQVAVWVEAIDMLRWDSGQPIVHTPLGVQCERAFGAPFYAIHRADLQQGMLSLLPSGIVRLGMRCESVTERPAGIELGFADGASISADAVVGADGIHSTVRGYLFSDQPRFSGQIIYRGLVPAERVPALAGPGRIRIWLGSSQHFVAYPVSAGKMISFGATVPAASPHVESWSSSGQVADVDEAYSGWHAPVRSLIASTGSVTKWALHDRDMLQHWSSDRVTFVGDAAHPMWPFGAQGANQAIEDAVVLAACLRQVAGGSVVRALRNYERLRMPRVAIVHQRSRANARTLRLTDDKDQRQFDADSSDTQDLDVQQWLYGYDADLAAEQSHLDH